MQLGSHLTYMYMYLQCNSKVKHQLNYVHRYIVIKQLCIHYNVVGPSNPQIETKHLHVCTTRVIENTSTCTYLDNNYQQMKTAGHLKIHYKCVLCAVLPNCICTCIIIYIYMECLYTQHCVIKYGVFNKNWRTQTYIYIQM